MNYLVATLWFGFFPLKVIIRKGTETKEKKEKKGNIKNWNKSNVKKNKEKHESKHYHTKTKMEKQGIRIRMMLQSTRFIP